MPSAAPDRLSSDVCRRQGSEGLLGLCRLRFDFDFVVMLFARIDSCTFFPPALFRSNCSARFLLSFAHLRRAPV
jgi:hypothetical protein